MYRKIHYMFVLVGLGIVFLCMQIKLVDYYDSQSYPSVLGTSVTTILWWTPFGSNGKIRTCGYNQCYFTYNRTFQFDPLLKSILFYGSDFHVSDLPNWRSSYVQWGLLHEESPRNNPILVQNETLNLFNYSSTFSRYSNVPLTLVNLPSLEELLEKKYFISVKEKTVLSHEHNLAPLLYIQSDCNTASNRDSYVLELMKYIKIDSYGACVNNKQLPEKFRDNYLDILDSSEFLSFVAQYKFTIAFENAVCEDYITEKLWRPLIVGSVPIYYGSPSFKDWLPNENSAISVLDFLGPKELAGFLLNLINDDYEYNKFLSHKLLLKEEQKINNRLLNILQKRPEGPNEFGNYVEEFECFVCNKVHDLNQDIKKPEMDIVTEKHYDCPVPRNPLSKEIDKNNLWVQQWAIEKCGAKLLKHHLKNNLSINIKYFNAEKLNMYTNEDC